MHRLGPLTLAAACAVLLAGGALAPRAAAAPAVADSSATYSLDVPPSAIETGCEGPCACPIVSTPTYGSFRLVFTHSDPLFDYFDVRDYIASPNTGPGFVFATGTGQYKIGGEFALTQEMTLDLVISGRPPQHFDSGVVPINASFPKINVRCAAHGFACVDTVVVVDAVPVGVTGVGPAPHGPVALESVRPNPFAGQARIAFALDRATRVDLAIVDVRGRAVRTLVRGVEAGPGERVATWDGRQDDGRAAPAGIYWARLTWPGGVDRRAIVKVNGPE